MHDENAIKAAFIESRSGKGKEIVALEKSEKADRSYREVIEKNLVKVTDDIAGEVMAYRAGYKMGYIVCLNDIEKVEATLNATEKEAPKKKMAKK